MHRSFNLYVIAFLAHPRPRSVPRLEWFGDAVVLEKH